MRKTFKHRGQRVDNNEWVYGYSVFTYNRCYIISNEYIIIEEEDLKDYFIEVKEDSVSEFIGSKDINGKDIFDKDIVKSKNDDIMLVSWNQQFASFCLDKKGWAFNHFFGEAGKSEDFEVIGNELNNPELIK